MKRAHSPFALARIAAVAGALCLPASSLATRPASAPPAAGGDGPGAATFAATGHAPAWALEVNAAEQLNFTVDGSAFAVAAPDLADAARHGSFIYGTSTGAGSLLIEIVRARCADARTGRLMTHAVRIRHDGREYRGCGAVRSAPLYPALRSRPPAGGDRD